MNTGRIITSNSRIGLRNELIEKHLPDARRLARGLRDGQVSVQGFVSRMRRIIKNSYLQQWALQRGGLNAMTSNDLITLSLHTQRQHEFLTKVCRTDQRRRIVVPANPQPIGNVRAFKYPICRAGKGEQFRY